MNHAPGQGPTIRIEGLGKTYGRGRRSVRALGQVTLDIPPGVTAVVGPNGAGKSTLLGLLLGFLHPTDGSVRIEGLTADRYRRARGAGYLPERFRLPAEWPVAASLRALARLDGLDSADADRRAAEALDRLGLGDHADRAVGTLSRGLGQRLGLAQAVLGEHALVVLDEPTEGLDPLWRVRFRQLVRDLRDRGRTVVLASHELAEVERMADRAVLLDAGRVRDVLELTAATGEPGRYRIEVAGALAALDAAFPGATPDRPAVGGEPEAGAAWRRVEVSVADAVDLSTRLAAFVAAGGVIRRVVPAEDALEDRVRRRLEEEP